jgi:hypothetical protein
MIARLLMVCFVSALVGCATEPAVSTKSASIEFLTRSGCVQTKIMRVRLDKAIEALGAPITYDVVDLDSLPKSDVRAAYPTPTILVGRVDMFGMTEPTPPYPEPT